MKKRLFSLLVVFTILVCGCGTEAVTESVPEEQTIVPEEKENSDVGITVESSITVPGYDNHRVFYEIFVGSFSDSDGDGVGDLRGIINRFDYLNDGDDFSGESLGIAGIWLSPINTSPSYHKYDVKDYYEIDPEFGTMDDLKELVSLAHDRNVKVIMDFVINHTSSQNEWFKKFCEAHKTGNTEDPYYEYYTYSDVPISGRAFSKIPGASDYYECNFVGDMPELNYDNPEVYEEILGIAKYYLEEVGVDGFRFDAAKYIYYGTVKENVDFWNKFIDDLKAVKPDIYTVAEVWDSDSVTDKYAEALNCFDFTMSQTSGKIADAAKKGNVNSYVNYVDKYLETVQSLNESAMILPFIANHDMDRAAGFLQASNGYAQMAANLYILGPGSPFIYYGEEIGMKGSRGGDNTDANRRLAMLWGDGDTVKDPVGTTYDPSKQPNGTVVEQLTQDYSLLNYYKKLIMMRKANPEIALGDYTPLTISDSKMGGFLCTYEGSSVAVFHNTTGSTQSVDITTLTDVEFTHINSYIGYTIETPSLEGNILTVPAQTSVVIR